MIWTLKSNRASLLSVLTGAVDKRKRRPKQYIMVCSPQVHSRDHHGGRALAAERGAEKLPTRFMTVATLRRAVLDR